MINIEYKKDIKIKKEELLLPNGYFNTTLYGQIHVCDFLQCLYSNEFNDFNWMIKIKSFSDDFKKYEKNFCNYKTQVFVSDKKTKFFKQSYELIIFKIDIIFFDILNKIIDDLEGDINIFLFSKNNECVDTIIGKDDMLIYDEFIKSTTCPIPITIYICDKEIEIVSLKEFFSNLQESLNLYLLKHFI